MGFVTLGIFTLNPNGVEGAILQMINHGIISAALFMCVGMIYERTHTREIKDYGGVAKIAPAYSNVPCAVLLWQCHGGDASEDDAPTDEAVRRVGGPPT